jgi:hypothetical protein
VPGSDDDRVFDRADRFAVSDPRALAFICRAEGNTVMFGPISAMITSAVRR